MLSDCLSQCQDGVFRADPVFRTRWVTVSQCQDGVFHADPVFWACWVTVFHSVRTESFTLILFSGHAEWLHFTGSGRSLSRWSCVPGPGVQVPAVYGLDSTDPSQWSHSVLQPAIRILSAISTVSLSVCLFAFLSVHLSVSTPHPVVTQCAAACHPHPLCHQHSQSVCLSVCLPVCPPVCQPGLNTPHPVVTQYAATCHLHYVCISTVSLSVFCHTGQLDRFAFWLFIIIVYRLRSWNGCHFTSEVSKQKVYMYETGWIEVE